MYKLVTSPRGHYVFFALGFARKIVDRIGEYTAEESNWRKISCKSFLESYFGFTDHQEGAFGKVEKMAHLKEEKCDRS